MALEVERTLVLVDGDLHLVGRGIRDPVVPQLEGPGLLEERPHLVLAGVRLPTERDGRVIGVERHHQGDVLRGRGQVEHHLNAFDLARVRIQLQLCKLG